MSRMTKFLRQKATITLVKRDREGKPLLDAYGDPVYSTSSTTVKCRRERLTKDVLTTNGAASVSTTRYFFDDSVSLDLGDKVDGKAIQTVKDFVNSKGRSEGWEVTV